MKHNAASFQTLYTALRANVFLCIGFIQDISEMVRALEVNVCRNSKEAFIETYIRMCFKEKEHSAIIYSDLYGH